ncbi:MAG: Nramp family divalent metal transporter, partial [Nitrososphaerales archaeon]
MSPSPSRLCAPLKKRFLTYLRYCGPGYLIAIGYMDPGNWATDIEAGSRFAYALLYVILLSNLMAMVLQYLSVRLGVMSGMDLAKACAVRSPAPLKWTLYVLAERAMMATDLAEVIGTAIALQLLFRLPLFYGVLLTSADVLLLLSGVLDPTANMDAIHARPPRTAEESLLEPQRKARRARAARNARWIEGIILVLMSIVAVCFLLEWILVQPSLSGIVRGCFVPDVLLLARDPRALLLALGMIGATVMPHNLYLHSYL